MKKNNFDEYIKKLLKCSANLFSGISLIIILVACISPIDLSAKTQITGFLAILCLIYSGYKVWNDAVAKIPSGNDFKIISKGTSFRPHAFLGDGRIDSKSHFTIDFDFINRFDQSIVLNLPEIISLSIDGELFASEPTNIYFKKPINSIVPLNFPYSIEKHTRESIRCEIDVPMLVSDRIAFAERLNGLNNYGSSRISVKKWLGSLWIRRNDNRYVRQITVNPNYYNHTESQVNKALIFE